MMHSPCRLSARPSWSLTSARPLKMSPGTPRTILTRSTPSACPAGVSGVSRDCSGSVALLRLGPAPPRLAVEAVADAPDGRDGLALWPQLLAQPHDMRIHRAVEAVIVVAPKLLQEEVTTESSARMRRQQRQQIVFFGRQVQWL